MSLPNHPNKYESTPIITPQKRTEYREEMGADEIGMMPEGALLCYSSSLMEYFTETYDGQFIDGGYIGDLYAFADTDFIVGVLGNFGVGAPVTAALMEELIGDGSEYFLSIGFSGGLDDTIEVGSISSVPRRFVTKVPRIITRSPRNSRTQATRSCNG